MDFWAREDLDVGGGGGGAPFSAVEAQRRRARGRGCAWLAVFGRSARSRLFARARPWWRGCLRHGQLTTKACARAWRAHGRRGAPTSRRVPRAQRLQSDLVLVRRSRPGAIYEHIRTTRHRRRPPDASMCMCYYCSSLHAGIQARSAGSMARLPGDGRRGGKGERQGVRCAAPGVRMKHDGRETTMGWDGTASV